MKTTIVLCCLLLTGISQAKDRDSLLVQHDPITKDKMKTIRVLKELQIDAPANEIFPMFCPVMEYDWIPDWKCELVYCPNGYNEQGVVFKEKMSSPFVMNRSAGKTTWTTLVYDTLNHEVHFQWDNSISSSVYKMKAVPINQNSSKLILDLTFNVINEKGMRSLDEKSEYKIGFMIEGLGGMLKYYCENKEKIDTRNSARKEEFVSKLNTAEKLKFLRNKIAMKVMKDRDRKSYLANGVITRKTLNRK